MRHRSARPSRARIAAEIEFCKPTMTTGDLPMTIETAPSLIDEATIQSVSESPQFAALIGKLRALDAASARMAGLLPRARALALCEDKGWDTGAALKALDAEIAAIGARIGDAKRARAEATDRLNRLNAAALPERVRITTALASAETDAKIDTNRLAAMETARAAAIRTLTEAGLTEEEAGTRAKPSAAAIETMREKIDAAGPRIAALRAALKDWVGLMAGTETSGAA